MVPAFLHVLISSFLETSRRQIVAYVTVRFSGRSSQKAFISKQGEQGTPVSEIGRKAGDPLPGKVMHGMIPRGSQATYSNWKKRYGGLLPDEMRRVTTPKRAASGRRHHILLANPITSGAELPTFRLRRVICRRPVFGEAVHDRIAIQVGA
jgi:putative transposase